MKITDWFYEWYLQEQQDEIRAGKLAMECPSPDCRRPVFMIKGKLSPVPVGMTPDPPTMQQILADVVPNVRSAEKANEWAIRSKWQSLEDFLTDPTQQPRAVHFRSGYWPHINT